MDAAVVVLWMELVLKEETPGEKKTPTIAIAVVNRIVMVAVETTLIVINRLGRLFGDNDPLNYFVTNAFCCRPVSIDRSKGNAARYSNLPVGFYCRSNLPVDGLRVRE
jgi:hypothetical protein